MCAEEGEIKFARELFLEARRADGASMDPPKELAEAAVVSAAKAAREGGGENPEIPPRANRGLEAVYNAMLTVSEREARG